MPIDLAILIATWVGIGKLMEHYEPTDNTWANLCESRRVVEGTIRRDYGNTIAEALVNYEPQERNKTENVRSEGREAG